MKHKIICKKTYPRKNRNNFIIICIILTICAVIAIVCLSRINKGNVASVNGVLVSQNEFLHHLIKSRAEVYQYFRQKYGVSDSKNFWTTSFEDEVPIDVARDRALEECTRIKVQQIMAKEKGITKDISYSTFLKSLKEENYRRKAARERSQVIYGPVQYSESEYYSYLFSNMVVQLKEKLQEEMGILDINLKDFYESEKERLYKKREDIKVSQFTIRYKDSMHKHKALLAAENIMRLMEDGDKNHSIIPGIAVDNSINIEIRERSFNDSTYREDEKNDPVILEASEGLLEGQVSSVLEVEQSFVVLICVERRNAGYKEYDEVKENVKTNYIEKKYNELIGRMVQEADIKINEKVFAHMTFR